MTKLFAVCLVVSVNGISAFGQSPYESSADFAKYAMKLRDQALSKVEPQVFVPTASRNTASRFPWKTNIVTTIFWIGETPSGNNPVPNHKSSWDANWTNNYCGFDTPDSSAPLTYIHRAIHPPQHPFYRPSPCHSLNA